ncbi:MAG TPA: thiol reductant ABC exporter subunit CydC [Chloroflexota bacterium]|nr:thiol reductant ABC exporter subunit CydC [Chloroflexota bacterium]
MIRAGRLLGFLRPYRRQMAIALLLGCATVATNVGLLAVAAYVIAAAALKPLLITLSIPIYLVQALGISRAFIRYGERLTGHRVTLSLLAELRVWLFSRLEPLAPAFLTRVRDGDLLVRLVSDLDEMQSLYLRVWAPAMVAIVMGAVMVAVFAIFSPTLALAAACFLLASGVAIPLLGHRLAQGIGPRQVAARADRESALVDGLQGMPDLLALGQAGAYRARVMALDVRSGTLERRQARVQGVQAALGDLVTGLAVWAVLVLAIPLVTQGTINGVYLGMLGLLMLGSFEAVQPLGQAFAVLGRSTAAAERILALGSETPAVTDPPEPCPIPPNPMLSFEAISFAYDGDKLVLQDLTFSLPAGRRIAVVGPSGAGKSTLAHLALRFWDPNAGAVRLGGRDIRQFALEDLRRCIAVAGQDTSIFTDTLRANLRMARPEATDAELLAALEQAQLGDLVAAMPEGLGTWLGEQGARLSGGERQRLAIARAMLRQAPILILDEPTANLDPLTEATLLDRIHQQTEGRSLLLITHRLVGMERMDEIIVLDQGRIVQRGDHAGLRAIPGCYRGLLKAQEGMLMDAR